MTQQLKGKIFWVLDDFAYIGHIVPKKDATAHAVARIENVVLDEYMIKFFVLPHDIGGELWSYNVNLLLNEIGTKYNGQFTEGSGPDHAGEVSCEMFSNRNKHMLYGRWIENEYNYTWWAIIDRE